MQRLSILLTILIVINIAACDSKTENYYKNHPNEAKEKAKECKESGILSEDCINALKIGVKPKNEESKYSPNTQTKSDSEITLEALKQSDLKKEKITKDANQSSENNESIIIPPIVETPSEIYPSKTKDNNQSSIFSDDINITQEKLP
ncbi:TPA: EexN family lipoprotein [Campylobacter jejuni]|nr:EexN family lipoprotein [Campylobacter jejuni]